MQNKKSGDAGAAQRVIKKYPNRRLYDTSSSAYITLAEVKQLVMDREAFVVRDAKTSEDLTRSILLQIILEEEANGSPMFTPEVLANIIRFYGHAMQGFMGGYLEKSMQTLTDAQARFGEQASQLTPELWSQFMGLQNPLVQGLMGKSLEPSKNIFAQMQEQMQKQTEQMLGTLGVKR
jgi:polyhydroxyalkanoate synthesis repressor PhaR